MKMKRAYGDCKKFMTSKRSKLYTDLQASAPWLEKQETKYIVHLPVHMN